MNNVNMCHQVAVSYYVDSAENKPGVVVNVRTKDLGNGVTKINACGKYVSGVLLVHMCQVSYFRQKAAVTVQQHMHMCRHRCTHLASHT